MERITNIDIYKPIVLYKTDTKEYLKSNKGIMVVWFSDGTNRTLDLTINQDTTNDVTIEYSLIKGKTKIKTLFENKEI